MHPFDFDAWRDLARRDPEAYFSARQEVIRSFIAERPDSADMLLELQAQIDDLRALAGTPINATREISRLLGEHLETLARQLAELRAESERLQHVIRSTRRRTS